VLPFFLTCFFGVISQGDTITDRSGLAAAPKSTKHTNAPTMTRAENLSSRFRDGGSSAPPPGGARKDELLVKKLLRRLARAEDQSPPAPSVRLLFERAKLDTAPMKPVPYGLHLLRIVACGVFAWALAVPALALDPHKMMTQFNHRSWGAQEGLDKVYTIAQTRDGYIWIGAGNGLFQFDGMDFHRWRPPPGEPNPPGLISALCGAQDGSLWCVGVGGVLQIKDGHSRLLSSAPAGALYKVCEMKDGTLWFGGHGLAKYAGGVWQWIKPERERPAGYVTAMTKDLQETLWVNFRDAKLEPEAQGALLFLPHGEPVFHVCTQRFAAAFDLKTAPDGKIWAAQTMRSVRAFTRDGDGVKFDDNSEIGFGSQAVSFDRDEALWVTTLGDGLHRLSNPMSMGTNEIGKAHDITDRFTQSDGLSSDVVLSIFEDREGNVWVGTSAGLDCFRESKLTSFSTREGLPFDQNLLLQATADGSIWAAAAPNGFEQLPPGQDRFINRGWPNPPPPHDERVPAASSDVYSLGTDERGHLLAGTGSGLIRMVREDAAEYLIGEDGPNLRKIMTMCQDSEHTLWLFDGNRGILKLPDGSNTPKVEKGISGDILAAQADGAEQVWLCPATGGIEIYHRRTGEIHQLNASDGSPSGRVRVILREPDGKVWFAGESGITRFFRGRFQTLGHQNGMPEDNLFALLKDDDGYFWLGGMDIIFRVSPAELNKSMESGAGKVSGEVFGLGDGLRGFVRPGALGYPGLGSPIATKGMDGRLWFSTSAGLTMIDPRHIPRNSVPSPVYIRQVTVAGKIYEHFEHLEFPLGTDACEIDYAGLCFSNPEKMRYRYILEGYDKDWVAAGPQRRAIYSSLRPGKYRFRVSACNNDGVWNEAGAMIGFAILPAFYQTAWFPVLCALVVGSVLWSFYRLRKARQEALRALQARLDRAMQIASFAEVSASIAHEINQPLAGVVSNANACLRFLGGAPPNLDEARQAAQRIVRDGNRGSEVVDRIRSLLKKEQPSRARVDINEIIREIVALAPVESSGAVLQMELPNDLPSVFADRVQLQQVLLNLITNALDAMKSISERPRILRIISKPQGSDAVLVAVQDSGAGIDPEKAEQLFETFYTTKASGMGLGLAICRSIIEAHGGRLRAERNNGPGATFQFTLPAMNGTTS
jgi:signal transduction histidine kinase/ligand-binding sensor domain-containing protein